MSYIGYTDLKYNEQGEYLAPASTASNPGDYPNIAVWNGNGYYDNENQVYFQPE